MSRSMAVHNKIEPRESLTLNSPSTDLSTSISRNTSSLTPGSLAAAQGLLGIAQKATEAQQKLFKGVWNNAHINSLRLSDVVYQTPIKDFAKCCTLLTPAAGKIVENTRKLIFGDNHSA